MRLKINHHQVFLFKIKPQEQLEQEIAALQQT